MASEHWRDGTGLPKSWEPADFAGYSRFQERLSSDRRMLSFTCHFTRFDVTIRCIYFCLPGAHSLFNCCHQCYSRDGTERGFLTSTNIHRSDHLHHVSFSTRTYNSKEFVLFRSRNQQHQCARALPKNTCTSP